MEQAEKDMPQKIMMEIVRFQNKLNEMGITNKVITADTASELINDKLVYTDTLKVGTTVLATATRIDPRPLEDIKTQLEAQKTEVQAQADDVIAKTDEIISKLPKKVDETPVESSDVIVEG